MKFAAVVVLLALAFGVESHVIGYSAHVSPLSYTAHGPFVNGVPVVNTYSAAPIVSTYSAGPIVSAYGAPVVSAYGGAPVVSAYSAGPVVSAYNAAPVLAAEGSYVAQTRGSVHIAPLPGHANSAASVNLEPAPGTL